MAEKIVVDIEFKTNVQKISKDLESVKENLEQTNESLDDIAKSGKGTETALGKLGKGFKGIGLAMKTIPIMIVVNAFNFLKDILMENQVVIDAVSIASETIGVVLGQVTSVITDVFEATSKSSEGFEGLKKVGEGLLNLVIEPLKLAFYGIKLGIQQSMLAWEDSFLGGGDEGKIKQLTADIEETKQALSDTTDNIVEAGKSIVSNFAEAVTEVGSVVTIATETAIEGVQQISLTSAFETGKALANAEKNAELLEVIRAKQQLQSQLDAEIQRQVRDDITKTFEERIQANDELGKILEEQTQKELEIANEKVRIAKMKFDIDKSNVENETAYQQALLEQIDINERIAGQRSEQLTNEKSLLQEQKDAINELALIGKTERELELEELDQWYKQKLELARKSGQDTEKIEEEFGKRMTALEKKNKMEQLDILQSSIQMAGNLFAEGTSASKLAGVTSATIDTYKAVNMALASAPPPLSFISAGLTLATGLKNVKEILSVKTQKPVNVDTPSGAGGIPSGGVGGSEQMSDLSSIPSMTEQFNQQFGQEQPVQAYVVEQDVTNSQQINTMIQQKATL